MCFAALRFSSSALASVQSSYHQSCRAAPGRTTCLRVIAREKPAGHGSPRKYWSRYERNDIATLATTARSIPSAEEVWCVFYNTASGAAIENGWELREHLIVDPALE